MPIRPEARAEARGAAVGAMRLGLQLILLALVYGALSHYGAQGALVAGELSILAPASGVALAALVLRGPYLLPGVAIGAFGAMLLAGLSWPAALIVALGSSLQSWVALRLLGGRFDTRLSRLRDVVRLAFGAAFAASLIGASCAVLGLYLFTEAPSLSPAVLWLAWWSGEAQGVLLLAPLLFCGRAATRLDGRLAEALVSAASVVLLLYCAAWLLLPGFGALTTQLLVSFAFFPLAVWPGMRFAMRQIATFNVAVAALCLFGLAAGLAPFVEPLLSAQSFGVQGLLLAGALTTLLLGAVSAERRFITEALAASEARFRDLTELSADWYWEQDSECRFVELSAGFRASSPFDRQEYLGKRCWELPFLDRENEAWQAYRRQVEARLPFRDLLLVRADREGALHYALLSGDPVFDAQGNFAGYRGVGTDITARQRAEEQSRESTARAEGMFRGSPQPIAISNLLDGRVIDVNDAWCRTYGYAREAVIDRNFVDLGLWVEPRRRDELRDTILADGAVRDFECRWRRGSGELAIVSLSAELIESAGERVLLSSAIDVTERELSAARLRESEHRFSTIFYASPVPIMIRRLADGAYVEVNDAWVQCFGYGRQELRGRNDAPPELWPASRDWVALAQRVASGEAVRGQECRLRRKSGALIDVAIWSERIELSGEPCILTSITDITERKRMERRLRESEQRFRDFADAAGEYVWEVDAAGRFTYVSPRVEQVLGYTPSTMLGRLATDFMPEDEQEPVREWYAELIRNGQPFRNKECRSLTRDGRQVWQLVNGVPIMDAEQRLGGYRGTALDISARKEAEAHVLELATRDALTGLPNRLLLGDRLAQALTNAQRSGDMLAVMYLDLDHFKHINDSLGHDIGDQLLQEVGQRISAVLRKGDTLSRQGGDEFVVVLAGLKSADDAAQVAQKIVNSLAEPYVLGGHTVSTACSVGIAVYPADGQQPGVLLRNADTAMYVAKASGRRTYQFFSPEMNLRTNERLQTEARLQGALSREELSLHYQAQVDLLSGELAGAEVLLRWHHPEQGLLPASAFLHVLEESGLIHSVGGWVLEQACRQVQRWRCAHRPSFDVAVNIAARQFNRALPAQVRHALTSSDLAPSALELEIAEAALGRNVEESKIVIGELRRLGVRVVVDDFGTGFSSMSQLRRLGVDGIKIAQSLVRGMVHNNDDRVVVQALMEMARGLGIKAMAEGVENEEQLGLLRRMGCERYSGRLVAEAAAADDFERQWLRTDNVVLLPVRRG